ncbi:MAG TPA: phosphatidate cytidylyltransferase [Sphingomicrobium sp.]|nr:phosphatidate cytidylyltransferase [Sphingomicrobium sp.]
MSNLAVRSLTGLALIVLALMAAYVGGMYFAVLAAAASTAIFYEWMRITRGWGFGWSAAGFAYALLAALALLWVRDRADNGLAVVIWIFLVTWATDIGGYFVGRAYGRRKLAPAISPNKTWAGLYGGIGAAILIAGGWVLLLDLDPALYLLSPILAGMAQVGDLFESWMKRRAGLKDSGNWLPGHGGIFDRLDGLIPVAILTATAQIVGVI